MEKLEDNEGITKFHLVIISFQGFPEGNIEEQLNIPHEYIYNIEYIDSNQFISLLKENNIKASKYIKYITNIKRNII